MQYLSHLDTKRCYKAITIHRQDAIVYQWNKETEIMACTTQECLDNITWDINETNLSDPEIISISFTQSEIDAYENYFKNGGGLFVTALQNKSLDVNSLNDFLNWTGFSVQYDSIHVSSFPTVIWNITSHPIMIGVERFDYHGVGIFMNGSAISLAQFGTKSVLGCMEGTGGGRIVVTGTNFFIDNWGITDSYNDGCDDATLAMKIIIWIGRLP